VRAIRIWLDRECRLRDRALFDFAIGSKLLARRHPGAEEKGLCPGHRRAPGLEWIHHHEGVPSLVVERTVRLRTSVHACIVPILHIVNKLR